MYVIIGRTFSKQALEKQAQKKLLQNMAHQKVYSMQVRGALLLKVFIVYAAFWILISLMFHSNFQLRMRFVLTIFTVVHQKS